MKDKYIRFDWAIKRLLLQKANFGVLEGLLTVLLAEEMISSITGGISLPAYIPATVWK